MASEVPSPGFKLLDQRSWRAIRSMDAGITKLFSLWNAADSDLPILEQARAEFAALR